MFEFSLKADDVAVIQLGDGTEISLRVESVTTTQVTLAVEPGERIRRVLREVPIRRAPTPDAA